MFRFMILVVYFGCVSCHFAATPKNVAVLAGERTKLECNATKIRKWTMMKPNNHETDNVLIIPKNTNVPSFGWNFSHFGAEVDNNLSGIIYINSTKLEDAGNYTCERDLPSGDGETKFSAQLIVLESLPDCNESQGGNSTQLQCTVTFRGFWSPAMEWSEHHRDGTADNNISMNAIIKTTFNANVTSTLTAAANYNDTHVFYSCKIFFRRSEEDMLAMNATNVPDFVYVWNSSTINISPQPAQPTKSFERSTMPISGYLPAVILGIVVLLIVLIIAGFIYLTIKRRKKKESTLPQSDNNNPSDRKNESFDEVDHYEDIGDLLQGCTNSPSGGSCVKRVGIDTPPCPTTENILQYESVDEVLQGFKSSTSQLEVISRNTCCTCALPCSTIDDAGRCEEEHQATNPVIYHEPENDQFEHPATNPVIYHELENDQLERPTTNPVIYHELENVQLGCDISESVDQKDHNKTLPFAVADDINSSQLYQ